MSTLNEKLNASKEKVSRIERNHKIKENAKKEKQRKIDTYRNISIGKIFQKYFPEVSHLHPQYETEANNIEFAELDLFIYELAENKENIARFKDIMQQKC